MSQVKIQGNAAGTGVFTVAAPATSVDRTLTLPDATTTLVGTDAVQTLTNKTISLNGATFAAVSGTAPLYSCRAWVNFNGTGTVAIRASGNVSSITDNGTGDYTVNFTTAMVDVNYTAFGQTHRTTFDVTTPSRIVQFPLISSASSLNTRTGTTDGPIGAEDLPEIFVAIFR